MDGKYPVYRKYKDIDTWFRVESEKEFTEVKRVGSNYVLSEVKAEKFPEILFINDMIDCLDGRWEICEASEFNEVLTKVS